MDFYARAVSERSRRRRLVLSLSNARERLEGGNDAFDVLSGLQSDLDGLSESAELERWNADQAVVNELKQIEADYKSKTSPGISSGILALDKLTGGFPKGVPTILAARPAVGKTSLLINLAMTAAKSGKPTLFITCEDRVPALAQRILAMNSRVSVSKIRARKLSVGESPKVFSPHCYGSGPRNLYFEHGHGITGQEFARRVRLAKRELGIELVMLDYLQLLGGEPGQSRFEKVSANAEIMAEIAGRENIALIVASQLNREAAKDSGGPALHQMRDSGVVEQVAKLVLALEDPGTNNDDLKLWVLKNHQGATGHMDLKFERQFCTVTGKSGSDFRYD